ncbi:MAG: pentapeptide repeat-containing protein [Nostocales cyanobacterium]|nr:MAG: pentapeptide repeat-containing protein [Nostocales cyanobacterium]
MTNSNSEPSLAALAERISQVEREQELRRKNIAWLKQYFDELKQDFNNRPELVEVQNLHQEIVNLTAQFADLQQCLNKSYNGSENLQVCENSNDVKILDDAEIVKEFFDRVERQQNQVDLIEKVAEVENIDVGEIERENEVDVVVEETQDIKDISVDAQEFWRRYEAGERDFTAINLAGVDLSGQTLADEVNLSQANLSNAILTDVNWSNLNLRGANLRGANFANSNLSRANLSHANLCGAALAPEDLSGVNLTSADLRGADLSDANLENANLKDANISGANLENTNLSGAIMPDGTTHN